MFSWGNGMDFIRRREGMILAYIFFNCWFAREALMGTEFKRHLMI
jgi:hypothetical protein